MGGRVGAGGVAAGTVDLLSGWPVLAASPGASPGAGLVRSTREEHVMWDPVDWDLVCDGEATEDDWWSWAEAEES